MATVSYPNGSPSRKYFVTEVARNRNENIFHPYFKWLVSRTWTLLAGEHLIGAHVPKGRTDPDYAPESAVGQGVRI